MDRSTWAHVLWCERVRGYMRLCSTIQSFYLNCYPELLNGNTDEMQVLIESPPHSTFTIHWHQHSTPSSAVISLYRMNLRLLWSMKARKKVVSPAGGKCNQLRNDATSSGFKRSQETNRNLQCR